VRGWQILDVGSTVLAFGIAGLWFGAWLTPVAPPRLDVWEFVVWSLLGAYLWKMGGKAVREPKAPGEIFGNLLLLSGVAQICVALVTSTSESASAQRLFEAIQIVIGGAVIWFTRHKFRAQKKEHLLVEQIAARGDVLQPEYHRATPECPHPERWHMYDSLSAEVEVLDFLKALVIALKPELVVETGTFSGLSTLRIAEGLAANGFGRIITCELDKKVYDAAVQRFAASGLASWIDARNVSSLEMKVNGRIDLLFCDSEGPLREQEVRRFLPQVNPNGLILIHDASSSLKIVREAALRLEAEGLLCVLLLPTPRGLVLAQKRAGRV
jgi:predicted O-methyltransferase YrrM